MLQNKRVLLIVGGGIAAYKSLELTRRLRERGCAGPRRSDAGRVRVHHTTLAFGID